MTDKPIYNEPSNVDAEDGIVAMKGPDDVDVKMTPDAAVETSDRLFKKSMLAQGQKVRNDRK